MGGGGSKEKSGSRRKEGEWVNGKEKEEHEGERKERGEDIHKGGKEVMEI